jgi:hypothetical protein
MKALPGHLPAARQPGGLLALAGLLKDWDTIEEDVQEIVASRLSDADRPLRASWPD